MQEAANRQLRTRAPSFSRKSNGIIDLRTTNIQSMQTELASIAQKSKPSPRKTHRIQRKCLTARHFPPDLRHQVPVKMPNNQTDAAAPKPLGVPRQIVSFIDSRRFALVVAVHITRHSVIQKRLCQLHPKCDECPDFGHVAMNGFCHEHFDVELMDVLVVRSIWVSPIAPLLPSLLFFSCIPEKGYCSLFVPE